MSARTRFFLGCAILALLMTGPFLLTALMIFSDAPPVERDALLQFIVPHLPLGTLMTALGFVLGVFVLRNLFKHYVRSLGRMAEYLRLMLSANRELRVAVEGPPEVRDLATAANDLAQRRDELLDHVDRRVADAKASLAEERNRLAALMSELTHAVVVCTLDGRILLYNNQARLQLSALASEGGLMRSAALVGLGRSIFTLLDRNRIAHALEALGGQLARGSAQAAASFATVTPGGQFLRVQLSPVRGPALEGARAELAGFVVSLENITLAHRQALQRDQKIRDLSEGMQRGLAVLRQLHQQDGARIPDPMANEIEAMERLIDATLSDVASAGNSDWPLEDVLGEDILAALRRQIRSRLELDISDDEVEPGLCLRADSFLLVHAACYLARRLRDDYDVSDLRLRLMREDAQSPWIYLDLIWSGVVVSSEAVMGWELDAMSIGADASNAGNGEGASLRDVLARHRGAMRLGREKAAHRAYVRLVLQAAERSPSTVPAANLEVSVSSRPEYYDFDLFASRDVNSSGVNLDARLSDLSYSVFDTETTGLEPSAGDEIIQIGAVRIFNGRLLRQEVIDQLVDPLIRVKPEGIPIHGITQEMVRGQPDIKTVLPVFHAYCAETVMVAHNAAFDMRFLQIKEDLIGLRFDQPVLDTLVLSAVIHPHQESHKLESICERLGITVIGRHTALGDAFVTGEVFLKMIPLLADMGIFTLRQAIDASRKTWQARVSY
jgi:DNA polymerase-3 subunit epsilon